jgi:hypothetical protein
MAELPEHLLRRAAEARAKATGRDVEEVLAEMKGEEPPAPAAPAAEPAAAESAPAAEPAAADGGGNGEAETSGIPAHLLERSRKARAAKDGTPASAPAPAAGGGGAAAPATKAPPAPTAPAIPETVRTQRLLTVVKARAIQQVRTEPADKVNVWPHLLGIEFVALLAVTAALTIFSVFVNAPLLELANFNDQPNPSKAPWYFLGLQELLSYFDPQVAGVLIPGLGLAGLAAIPYIDRNPSVRPSDRKLAIMIFTFFLMAAALLTIYGSFFRGPGFNFTFPWQDGLFFDF